MLGKIIHINSGNSITESTTKVIDAQKKFPGFLVQKVLDNKIALDYLLAEQAGVCAIVNTSCRT